MTEFELQRFSDRYVNDVYEGYRQVPPCEKGQLVDVHDEDGRLYSISRVMGVRWDRTADDWQVEIEVSYENGVCLETVSGCAVTRHNGFLGRAA